MKAWVRRHPLAALIIPALVMLLVGLVAGQFVKSPAQVAADAAPPEQTTLTAPVEKGKVQRTVPHFGSNHLAPIWKSSSTTIMLPESRNGFRIVDHRKT